MKKFSKIIGIGIILILLFDYLFYGRTVDVLPLFHNRTGEHYSKNNFNVFYEVTAGIGCDNCHKYDKKQRIAGADTETFEILNRYYTKDKNNFYICSQGGPDEFRVTTKCEKMVHVDRDSFKPIDNEAGDRYATDKNHVYFYGTAIENADRQSFRIIDNNYAADKNKVYYRDGHSRLHVVKEITSDSEMLEFFLSDRKIMEGEMHDKFVPTMEAFIGD